MPDEAWPLWARRDWARQPRHVAGKLPTEQPKGRPSKPGWPRETIMTPDTQQARTVVPRGDDPSCSPVSAPAGLIAKPAIAGGPYGRTAPSGSARAGHGGAVAQPSHASP